GCRWRRQTVPLIVLFGTHRDHHSYPTRRSSDLHELIPGHHLQGFMTRRYNDHRSIFNTPFWGEGWALYWELVLWDQGFPRGPEADRKSTRLNSSHVKISYAVFCLKNYT